MRVGLMAENPIETAVLASGVVPVPMLEAYAPVYARAIVIATKLGVFEALRDGGRSADEIAEACGTDPRATAKLLNLLVTMRYLRHRDGAYTLARHVKRWLLADSRGSVRDVILMKELEWSWIDQLETFVRDGRPLDVHGTMSTEDWSAYQRGMRAQANPLASWLARRVPVPRGPGTCSTSADPTAISRWCSAGDIRSCARPCSTSRTPWSTPRRCWSERRWGIESSCAPGTR